MPGATFETICDEIASPAEGTGEHHSVFDDEPFEDHEPEPESEERLTNPVGDSPIQGWDSRRPSDESFPDSPLTYCSLYPTIPTSVIGRFGDANSHVVIYLR